MMSDKYLRFYRDKDFVGFLVSFIVVIWKKFETLWDLLPEFLYKVAIGF